MEKRQDQLRKLVKAVVHCDIIHKTLQSSKATTNSTTLSSVLLYILEGASRNKDDYRSNLARLGRLVKPGGKIFYYGVENKVGYYPVGDRNFPNVHVDKEFSLKTFNDAGFHNLTIRDAPVVDSDRLMWYIEGTRD